MFSDLVQLNNLLAECFQSDLCTTRIYEKSYERQHTQNSLQRFFLSVHFHNIFGLFWAKHCIVWKLTDIDMKYPWREFSILCKLPFIAELTWIKSIRCGGFECPINDSTCENQNQVDCCLLTIFFCKLVRTASKVDLLGIFLLLKIQTDKVNLSYKVAN